MVERGRGRRRKITLAVGAVLLLVGLLVTLTFTPLFGARHIKVEGTVRLDPEAVAALAGVEPGTNVFHLDVEAATRALETDPWIESAEVDRQLPTTVVVRVIEREPVATADGATLAADGTVLPGAELEGLPDVEAVAGSLESEERTAAAVAAGAMAPVVRELVDTILVEPDGDLLILLEGSISVVYGQPGDDDAKAEALRALLRWAAEEGVQLENADISVPSAPTARPVGGEGAIVP